MNSTRLGRTTPQMLCETQGRYRATCQTPTSCMRGGGHQASRPGAVWVPTASRRSRCRNPPADEHRATPPTAEHGSASSSGLVRPAQGQRIPLRTWRHAPGRRQLTPLAQTERRFRSHFGCTGTAEPTILSRQIHQRTRGRRGIHRHRQRVPATQCALPSLPPPHAPRQDSSNRRIRQ